MHGEQSGLRADSPKEHSSIKTPARPGKERANHDTEDTALKDKSTPLRRLKPNLPFALPPEAEREQILQRHPEWRPIWDERDRQDAMVVQALREQAFLDVESVYDLVNTRESYPEAIPTLLQLLLIVSENRIKEGIVRALTVKEARGIAARPLIEEFKRIDAPRTTDEAKELGLYPLLSYKWTVGNAIGYVATPDDLEEIFALLTDPRHGDARQQLIDALVRLKPGWAAPLLIEFLNDPTVALQSINALGKLRAVEARPLMEPFLTDERTWVRQAARDAIQRIDKAIAKNEQALSDDPKKRK